MASNMPTLPIKVYRKNLMAEYWGRSLGWPQMPMSRYMGTRPISQKT